MDKSTKAITLAATSKNLKRNNADVFAVLYARLRQLGCVLSLMCCVQCTECFSIECDQFRVVPRLDGARAGKISAPPVSKLRSFRSKCTVLKKVLATLLGLFDAPSDSAPWGFNPLLPPGPVASKYC